MSSRTSFTPEEWTQLLDSVFMVGLAVSAAEPIGLWGLLKESFASDRALFAASTNPDSNELIKAVADDLTTREGQNASRQDLQARLTGSTAADTKATAITALQAVGALLDTKAVDDAAAFKAWLLQVGEQVAAASRKGGFLGFGGVEVSEAEQMTLAEISTALGLSPSGP